MVCFHQKSLIKSFQTINKATILIVISVLPLGRFLASTLSE